MIINVTSIVILIAGIIMLGISAASAMSNAAPATPVVTSQTPTPAGPLPQAPDTNVNYTTPAPVAGTVPDMPDASDKAAERHCFSKDGTVQCFDTQAEALRIASNGRIQLAPGQTSATMDPAILFAPGTNIQGVMWEDTGYSGSSWIFYRTTCDGGYENAPSGWNDIVSSAQTSSCGVTLYEWYNGDRSGATLKVNYPGTTNVGVAMNDQASSWTAP